MDMDLSWCPVCERAIVERDEIAELHEGLPGQTTKPNKTSGAHHSTAKALFIGQQRPRKSAHSGARTLVTSSTKPRSDDFGQLTDRGAVYAPKGGLYCSEACRAIDELSGQRAFEELAVLSCFLPTSPVPRIAGGGRARSEVDSDYCPSTTTTTTSGTDEEGESDGRQLSASNLVELSGGCMGSKASSQSHAGLRPTTFLERPIKLRSQSELPSVAPVAITDQNTGRQCRSVEGSGLAKQKTPILLAPNGTPLVQRTFPQRQHIHLDQPTARHASVPTRTHRSRIIETVSTPPVSLASDYGLFFNTASTDQSFTPKPQRQPKPACWSWDHLPADVPQYPAMDLARVRRSMGVVVEEKISGSLMKQSRKRLFVFNSTS